MKSFLDFNKHQARKRTFVYLQGEENKKEKDKISAS